MAETFGFTQKALSEKVHWYTITRNGQPVSYKDALGLWQSNKAFCLCFDSILNSSPFSAYRWETPPITNGTIDRRFEFVLLDSPELACTPDPKSFAEYFTRDDSRPGIVTFENLGRDATLVVPSPRGPDGLYSHLAAFIRGAPEGQKHEFWKVVGRCAQRDLTDKPLWISTAGGGVAWLHVRLDCYPKYYRYGAYRGEA